MNKNSKKETAKDKNKVQDTKGKDKNKVQKVKENDKHKVPDKESQKDGKFSQHTDSRDTHPSPTEHSKSPNEDTNFDEEYDKVLEHAGGIVTQINELRTTLDDQQSLFHDRTLKDLFDHSEDLKAVRTTTSRAKKVLRGSGHFLVDDLSASLLTLHRSLENYSQLIVDKLQKEYGHEPEHGSRAAHPADHAHEEFARLADELKELVQYSDRLEEVTRNMVKSEEKQHEASMNGHHDDKHLAGSEEHDAAKHDKEHETDHGHEQEQNQDKAEDEAAKLREAELEAERIREKELEEQRRRQREEDERKRAEEEARRKEEEEARRLEEEERLRKEDPRHWPAIVYDSEGNDHHHATAVTCVVRSPPEAAPFRKEQLRCTNVDWTVSRYPVSENEEIVATVVSLKPTSGHDLEFESAVWIALPYSTASRGREIVIRVQSARVPDAACLEKNDDEKQLSDEEEKVKAETKKEPAEWSDVMTRDTTVEGQESVRFVETPIKHIDGCGINMVVLARPKRDIERMNNRGGRLISTIDSRVSIGAPKNAFRLSTEISIQVIQIDSIAMSGLKERYDGCDMLLGASPLICIAATSKPQKPLVVSVTNPSGGSKKPKAGGKATAAAASGGTAGSGGGTSLPKATKPTKTSGPTNGGSEQDEIDDVIQLMVKDIIGKWRHRDNVKLEQQRDCVVFQLNDLVQRLILLRAPPTVTSVELCRIATCLESSLIERPAQLVVRQREDDPSSIFIELCRRDAVDRLLNSERLRSLGFTEGPEPSRLVCLREGDLLELSFRDNIEPIQTSNDGTITQGESTKRFIFNSNLMSLNSQLTVRERSSFAQNALDAYRGYVRLSLVERSYEPPPKVAGPSGISAVAAAANAGNMSGTTPGGAAGGAAKKTVQPTTTAGKQAPPAKDRNLVCEIMLTLPKPPKEVAKVKRADFIVKPDGPLSSEYYDQLAEFLGDEWMRLAEGLGLGKPAIQRIVRGHSHLENRTEIVRQSARDALIQWHRSSSKFSSKVDELRQALIDAGRNDLAEELNAKNKEYRRDIDKKHEGERLKKSIKAFTDNITAIRAWREVGRELGLSNEELEAIGGPAADTKRPATTKSKGDALGNSAELRAFAEKMLKKWIELDGEDATTDQLITALKKRKLMDTAACIMVIK